MHYPKTRLRILFIALCTLCLTIPTLALPQSDKEKAEPVATVKSDTGKLIWEPKITYEVLTLTVATPEGEVERQEARPGTTLSFNVIDKQGARRPDGQYQYELRVTPLLGLGVREALAAARQTGNDDQIARDLRRRGLLPTESLVQSGSFRIQNGAIVSGGAVEGQKFTSGRTTPRQIAGRNEVAAPTDQVFADDLIVQGSICVGFDCVNNESFGFDTIRLKENNTRIKFEDTSVGTFPSTDWQLTANDSASGGANQFSLEDVTGAKVPFKVVAGAPTNSLLVNSNGNVGFGTSTPVLDQHTLNGNTPALRLEQDGSSGFSPQTWDVAGNEANFFVRDVTSGSKLPFRIQPGADTNTVYLSNTSRVGIGTNSPEAKLHVFGNAIIEGSLEVRDGSFFSAKAMKELNERLTQREDEIRALKQKNTELQARQAELEKRLQAIEARLKK